jgi:glutamyl-tRNA synthetase
VKANLETVAEADAWLPVFRGEIPAPAIDAADRSLLAAAAARLAALVPQASAPGPDTWAALTEALKAETGRRGKALFLPLRLALTGRAHGPDMALLLPLIGRDRALARLERVAP